MIKPPVGPVTALMICLIISVLGSAHATVAPSSDRSTTLWIIQFNQPALLETRHALIAARASTTAVKGGPIDPSADEARIEADLQQAELVLRQQHRQALQGIQQALGRSLLPRWQYLHASTGMAIALTAAEANDLRHRFPQWSLQPDRHFRLSTDSGPAWVGAEQVWQGGSGNLGAGTVVGVLDSGINAAHPAFAAVGGDGHVHSNPRGQFLGLCQTQQATCNNKLIGIHDFTTEGNQNGLDLVGHGSHVASIAVGNVRTASVATSSGTLDATVSGVAPHANLISYKVCTVDPDPDNSSGTCAFSSILAALDQLAIDLPDVMNFSIGSDPRDPWSDDYPLVMLNLRQAGVLTVTSAGNSGPNPFTVGTPANAPWMLSVANITHDRSFQSQLVDSSGGSVLLADLTGASISGGTPILPVVHARDFGNALCGTGPAELQSSCEAHTGSSNPFPPGTFSGQIVVCDRGTYGRIEKGFNVRAAGAAGYILANTDGQAESIVADQHCLPAVHLGDRDGDTLRSWLDSGSNHSGRITDSRIVSDPELGDVLAASSSRGPALDIPGLMKPDLAAPGSNILGASGEGAGPAFLSGTSMASPHVAGAAALLRADHPDWAPDVLHSVLVSTAFNDGMRDSDGSTPAGTEGVGAGRLRVDQAVQASMYLPITRSEFLAANPTVGGQPASLNLPAISGLDCTPSCSARRTLTALEAGSWTFDTDLPAGVVATVTPDSFSGSTGQSVTVELDITMVDPSRIGQTVEGLLLIQPDDPSRTEQRLPLSLSVAASSLPERIVVESTDDRGTEELSLDVGASIETLDYRVTGLSLPATTVTSLFVDDAPSTPFDDLTDGVYFEFHQASAGERLLAQTAPVSNRDLDLFVGLDADEDGLPDAEELLCSSRGSGALERCLIEIEDNGAYWVLVQNVVSQNIRDGVRLEVARFSPGDDSLLVTGPGSHPDATSALSMSLAWAQPAMEVGQTWVGLLDLLDGRDPEAATVAQLVIEVDRQAAQLQPGPDGVDLVGKSTQLLLQDQHAEFSLQPGQAHGQLLVYVPADATGLELLIESTTGTSVYLIHEDDWLDASGQPTLAGATSVTVSSQGIARAQLDATQLRPGLWRAVVTHAGSTVMTGSARAVLQRSTAQQIDPIQGLWFNPERDGAGFNLNRNQNTLVFEWYTYRPDGTPTWYLVQAEYPQPGNVWQADLLFFNWDGSSAQSTDVGEVELVFETATRMRFNYQIYGQHRSESYQAIVSTLDCASQGPDVALTGLWFVPAQSGFGYSILSLEGQQIQINYLYDQAGYPRWAYGQGPAAAGQSLPLAQFDGFCSYCTVSEVASNAVGRNITMFDSPVAGSIDTSLQFQGNVVGDWSVMAPISNLTPAFDCN